MKWILILSMCLTAELSHADTLYQSGPYGAGLAVGPACSSSKCLDGGTMEFNLEQYIGQTFSLSSAATVTTIDFYKGLVPTEATSVPVDIPSDITIAFYDTSYNLVNSQTFAVAEYTQTELLLGPGIGHTYNVHAAFMPFELSAGNYIVYYYGDHLGVDVYDGYGDTSVLVLPSQGLTFDNPFYGFGTTGVKLSGSFLTAVPEPANTGMLLAGLGFVGVMQRRIKLNS